MQDGKKYTLGSEGLQRMYENVDMQAYNYFVLFMYNELDSSCYSYIPFTTENIVSVSQKDEALHYLEDTYNVHSIRELVNLFTTTSIPDIKILNALVLAIADQYKYMSDKLRDSNVLKRFLDFIYDSYINNYTVTALLKIRAMDGDTKGVEERYYRFAFEKINSKSGILYFLTEFNRDIEFCAACSILYNKLVEYFDKDYDVEENYKEYCWFIDRCKKVDFSNTFLKISDSARNLIEKMSLLAGAACTISGLKKYSKFGVKLSDAVYLNYVMQFWGSSDGSISSNFTDMKKIISNTIKVLTVSGNHPETLKQALIKSKIFGSQMDMGADAIFQKFGNYIQSYDIYKDVFSDYNLLNNPALCFLITDLRVEWYNHLDREDKLINLNWNLEVADISDLVDRVNTMRNLIPLEDDLLDALRWGYLSSKSLGNLFATNTIGLNLFGSTIIDGELFSIDESYLNDDIILENVISWIREFDTEMKFRTAIILYQNYGIHFIASKASELLGNLMVMSYYGPNKYLFPVTDCASEELQMQLFLILNEYMLMMEGGLYFKAAIDLLDYLDENTNNMGFKNMHDSLYTAISEISSYGI